MRYQLLSICLVAGFASAQTPDGRVAFQSRCTDCHGTDANGGEHGPSIRARLPGRTDQELMQVLRDGVPQRGMPSFKDLPEAEIRALVAHLRTLAPPPGGGRGGRGVQPPLKVQLTSGKEIEGTVLNRTGYELQGAHRRSEDPLAARAGRAVPRGDLAGRLDQHARRLRRQSLQPDEADRHVERVEAGAQVGVRGAELGPSAGHAAGA